jgi:hypothetical protein
MISYSVEQLTSITLWLAAINKACLDPTPLLAATQLTGWSTNSMVTPLHTLVIMHA